MNKLLKEFKEFIAGGNMIELAVAFILGAAMAALIKSFTEDIMMQIVAAIFGQPDFSTLTIDLGDATLYYGRVINAFITLVMVGVVLFFIVKAYNRMREEKVAGPTEVDLLTEIRDTLRTRS